MARFLVTSHRGTDPYPDHSFEALTYGIDWGGDRAELDIQMTSDGVLVVAHDTNQIPRTTWADLHAAQPGILTLQQAIEIIRAKGIETGRGISTSIEMKNPVQHQTAGLDIAAALADLMAETGFYGDTISVSSFHRDTIQRFATQLLPERQIDTAIDYVATSFGTSNLAAYATWADSISTGIDTVNQNLVNAAHAVGLEVHVWTHFGTGDYLQRHIDMGVDGVYSDNTRVAREFVDSVDGLTTIYAPAEDGIVGGTAGADRIFGMQADSIILGGAGDDEINGDGGDDVLVGGSGSDLLRGGGGQDALIGGEGADTLIGSHGNDAIVADAEDTIHYTLGDGIDLVQASGTARVMLSGITTDEIEVSTLGSSLVVSFQDSGAVVFDGGIPDIVVFGDGSQMIGADLAARASGNAGADIADAVVELRSTLEEAAGVSNLVASPNLIVNGSFENINGTSSRTWGRYDPDGDMVGWTNLDVGRVEQHQDTVEGVSASEGAYWTDLDGWLNNVRLAQDIQGMKAGTSYRLKFDIADTDAADNEELVVSFGGESIHEGAPSGNTWETHSIDIVGGSGDGTDRLVFAQTGDLPNGAGIALDNISVIELHAPTDLLLSSVSLDRTAGKNTVVGTLSAIDGDALDGHTFELVSGTEDGANGLFEISNGALVALDPATMAKSSYEIRVRVTDADGFSHEKTIAISVSGDAPITPPVAGPGTPGTNPGQPGSEAMIPGSAGIVAAEANADGSPVTVVGNIGTIDEVQIAGSLVMGAELENAYLLGNGDYTVEGNDLDNVIYGGAGNETFIASGGRDLIDGGWGNNTVRFSGPASDYSVEINDGLAVVTSQATGDVTRLANIQTMEFADGGMPLFATSQVEVAGIYRAFLARDLDASGFAYWIERSAEGLDILSMMEHFAGSSEFLEQSEATNPEEFVANLYTRLLLRDGEPAGAAYWMGRINDGSSYAEVALNFVSANEVGLRLDHLFQRTDWLDIA